MMYGFFAKQTDPPSSSLLFWLPTSSFQPSPATFNKAVLGQNPSGLLTYTADGRMMAIISDDGRKPLSVADRVSAEERAQAFSTFMAYAGRYTFTCDKVVHHVEIASLQNWVNTDQTPFVTLQYNRLTVRTTPISRAGAMVNLESVWERLK
jgi:hypothetical protein